MFQSYMQRKLDLLYKRYQGGNLGFSKEFTNSIEGKQLFDDLNKLKKSPNGSICLESTSKRVRGFAKSFFLINQLIEQKKEIKPNKPEVKLSEIIQLQREYFNLLYEFFVSAFNKKPEKFSKDGSFSEAFQNYKDEKSLKRIDKAYWYYMPLIFDFHKQHSSKFLATKEYLGGFKYVVGGTSRLPNAAVDGIRKYLLYADTIFVPDPILPWLEVERKMEKFHLVRPIDACYSLLKLKPIIDAELPYPAILIFPSWEKTLALHDNETKDLLSEFILDFFGHYLNYYFEDESEIINFINTDGKTKFREIVIREHLFLPPGHDFPSTFEEAENEYLEFINKNRSEEYINKIKKISPETLILNGIIEWIEPQFHARDNAKMLNSHPLFWLPSHFHYYTLCSNIRNNEFQKFGIIKKETLSILRGLNSKQLNWLGNIPINSLVELRKNNENEDFRKKMKEYFDSFCDLNLEDINTIGPEVCRAISSLLSDHDKKAKSIVEKYNKKHITTLVLSFLTSGVLLCPWLSPYFITVPTLSFTSKFFIDKYNKYSENKILKNSLFGVLSSAEKQ